MNHWSKKGFNTTLKAMVGEITNIYNLKQAKLNTVKPSSQRSFWKRKFKNKLLVIQVDETLGFA